MQNLCTPPTPPIKLLRLLSTLKEFYAAKRKFRARVGSESIFPLKNGRFLEQDTG